MTVPTLRPIALPAGFGRVRRPRPERPRLGQMLVDGGALSAGDQLHALALQGRIGARYGEILIARGLIAKDHLYNTIARQYDTDIARFEAEPPDEKLIETIGVDRCLSDSVLPWKRVRGITHVATSRPETFAAMREDLAGFFGPLRMVIAADTDMHAAVLAKRLPCLAAKAETRVAADASCRDWSVLGTTRIIALLAIVLLLAIILWPAAILVAVTFWAAATMLVNTGLKAAATLCQLWVRWRGPGPAHVPKDDPGIVRLPTVSILVPLYKEREVANRLVARLSKLNYPRELLDICLVVEADDAVTGAAIDQMRLPGHIRRIVVPASKLKTKPRALNYALDFCRGSIVGVYDAEDLPDRDQINRIVQRFQERGPEVACLQGMLDFYNSRVNWLSRCFAVEYAAWFRLILPGMTHLGLVVPLGGTTLFFRRSVLEELGGWDAHNVTEDADLGIRLARHGYRTELIDTVTEEEANARVWPWIKQRSRWLKGYAITWAVHMRSPRRLLRDLGLWRFLGVQALFLGTLSQFMLAPLLWSFWLVLLGLPHPISDVLSPEALFGLSALFLASEAINIAVGLIAVSGRKHRHLSIWVPSLHLYFPLAALASYKGIAELLFRPFFWDKTAHGVFDTPEDTVEEVIPPLRPRRRRA